MKSCQIVRLLADLASCGKYSKTCLMQPCFCNQVTKGIHRDCTADCSELVGSGMVMGLEW